MKPAPPAINERVVLQLIGSGAATSQVRIAESLEAPRNTVNGVVQGLIRQGLISLDRLERYGRGRPIQHYRLRQRKLILVIEWLGSVWNAALFSDGKFLGKVHTRHAPQLAGMKDATRVLLEIRDTVLNEAKVPRERLSYAILTLNAVRTRRQQVLSSSVVPWIQECTAEMFEKEFGCRVLLEPSNTTVSTELRARASESVTSLAVLNVGDGVSAHGQILDPAWGSRCSYLGELGHIVVDPKGPICGCGHRGCLEAIVSGPALRRRLLADIDSGAKTNLRISETQSFSELFNQLERIDAEGADAYASELVAEFIDRLAWGVSLVTNLIGPEVIVLSGYGLHGRERWRQRIKERAGQYILPLNQEVRLEFARLTLEEHLRQLALNHLTAASGQESR
jgi:predicted NBD/HSP70 family sugar kinase